GCLKNVISSRKISLIRLGENSTSGEYFFQGGLPVGRPGLQKTVVVITTYASTTRKKSATGRALPSLMNWLT
ncbi:hypothetical protein, partial [Pseudomonas lundensis]|uniref:hypothetical protein n=1 Tax=Pseudomonas lundensis TaxID=86185 RepID=UPI001F0A95DF